MKEEDARKLDIKLAWDRLGEYLLEVRKERSETNAQ
jgi:hypothetical protein